MENRINKVLVLDNGKKYIVVKQAVYKDENYYAASEVTEDEQDVLDVFAILHEYKKDGDSLIEIVTDPAILKLIIEHLDLA